MNHFINSAIVLLIIVFSMDFTAAQTGVCYGRNGAVPSPSDAVRLCTDNNIRQMRIYGPDRDTLQALTGSDIELIIGVWNKDLQNIAASQDTANAWVNDNIQNFPGVTFRYIAVGNEVSPRRSDTAEFVRFVLPAMRNIYTAVSSAGLTVKVSTSVETGLVDSPYPPSDGVFHVDVRSYINPIVQFLAGAGAPLLVNVYTYFSYIGDKANIPLDYALLTSDGMTVPGGVHYQNLFYAMVDATYAALEKSGGASVEIVVSESGWPSDGGDTTSVENARVYNTNLIQRVRDGTPKRPGKAIETYIFALFDEDRKEPDLEKHWGIFLANAQPKYQISFN